MADCKTGLVHDVTGLSGVGSELHDELRNLFPDSVDSDGVSSHYAYLLTDEFANEFGNWTDPSTYEELQNASVGTTVFNEQGEPRLHRDLTLGNFYFLNAAGKRINIGEEINTLTADESFEIVNTLTAEYIVNPSLDIPKYVSSTINSRIQEIEQEIQELQGQKATATAEKKREIRRTVNYEKEILRKLKSLAASPAIMKAIQDRMKQRLENFNYRYTQDITTKEDDPNTHEDILNHILESNQTSNRAINDPVILQFLSTVPKFESYNRNSALQVRTLNPFLLTPSYMDQAMVWNLLETILSDIISTNTNPDVFDSYIKELEVFVEFSEHPELNYILSQLKNVTDENFKVKFAAAFHKARQNYSITTVNEQGGKMMIKIVDPAVVNSKSGKIASELIESTLVQNLDIPAIKRDAMFDFKLIRNSTDRKVYEKFLDDLLVKGLNLNLNDNTIPYLVKKSTVDNDFGRLRSFIDRFLTTRDSNYLVDGQIEVLNSISRSRRTPQDIEKKEYLIRNSSFFKLIAEAEKLFKLDLSESTVIVGGSQRWQYSFMSGLKQEILKLKQGEDSILTSLRDRNLMIVDELMDPEVLENIEVYTNSEIKSEVDSNPVLHKRITEPDLHIDILAKMFNSRDTFYTSTIARTQGEGSRDAQAMLDYRNYMTYNFGADKNSLFTIYGLPLLTKGMDNLWDFKNDAIGSDFKNILRNYVAGELERTRKESVIVDGYFRADNKQEYAMNNLIPDFHYKTKKDLELEELTAEDFKAGEYFKPGIFSSSFTKYLENNTGVVSSDPDVIIVDSDFSRPGSQGFDEFMEVVYDDFNQIFKDEVEYLENIVVRNVENDEGDFVTTKLFDIQTNFPFQTRRHASVAYAVNSFLNSYELSNLFNGHISMYKQSDPTDQNLVDFLKRAPAVNSDGLYLYPRENMGPKEYKDFFGNTVTIDNSETETVIAVIDNFDMDSSKFAEQINKGLEGSKLSYAHEIADAQGFITPGHFRDIVSRIYGWEAMDQQMFDQLMDPSHQVTDKNIRWIKNFSKAYTPLKMVHFEVQENGMPVYLKYSTATLFPAITAGSDAQKVLDQMLDQGVEQLIFKSGSKASNKAQTRIHTEENGVFTGLKEQIRFNPFTIDTGKLKMQLQMPTKLDGSISLGNQAIKNIMVNMNTANMDEVYNFQGSNYNAQDLYDLINNTAVGILQKQLNEVLSELGYKDNKLNIKSVKRLLLAQLDAETESDLKGLLETDLPIEAIPNFGQRAYPVIAAFLRKNAGKLYTKGASVAQVANIGFDRLDGKAADNILYLTEQTELTPPIPKLDSEGNIIGIEKAKILLPYSSILAESNMSFEEFKEAFDAGRIDRRLFNNVIGYRIPNQAVSSNDSFEVVGILPPIAGDQAIVYHEITAKTGSDFDIDKMYLMLPNFQLNGDRVEYVEDDSKAGLQNKLIELFTSVLESPVSYDDLMSPLDNKELIKGVINDIKYVKAIAKGEFTPDSNLSEAENRSAYEESNKITGMQQLMPSSLVRFRTDVLEAKNLISIMANNMTDLGESQKVGFSITHDLGFGETSLAEVYQIGNKGNSARKISKIVSYLMNASVDAAKDNYLIEGNMNSYTANPAMLMVRLGVPLEKVFSILLNDTIVDLSKLKIASRAKTANIAYNISQEQLDEHTKLYINALAENDGLLDNVISEEDFITNNPDKQELILGFWNLLVEQAKEMNESVVITKSDANSAGTNFSELLAFNNRLEKVFDRSTIQNSKLKWFKDKNTDLSFNPTMDDNYKYLGAMANNTLLLMNEISSQLFLETTPKAIETVNSLNNLFGRPLEDDPQQAKIIYNYLYPSILKSTGHDIYNIDQQLEEYLLGEFTNDFVQVKRESNNTFLQELYIRDNFITFPNYKNFSKEDVLRLKEAFTELYNNEPRFTDHLVQYAFLTSAFRPTIYSFNQFIPASYFVDRLHGRSVQETLDRFSDAEASDLDLAKTATQIAKNNHNNFRVVKKMPLKLGAKGFTPGKPITNSEVLNRLQLKDDAYAPFVKYGRKGGRLYMLTENIIGPVYEQIQKIDTRSHQLYSFNNIEKGLDITETEYTSKVDELFGNRITDINVGIFEDKREENC